VCVHCRIVGCNDTEYMCAPSYYECSYVNASAETRSAAYLISVSRCRESVTVSYGLWIEHR
jgi:hypothetical protein